MKEYEERCAPETIENYKVTSIRALMRLGAQVNEVDERTNKIPLLLAAKKPKNLQLVQILLEHGADPNIADRATGYTPLLMTVSKPHNADMIVQLMRYGADPYRTFINDFDKKKIHSILQVAQKVCIVNYTALVSELAHRVDCDDLYGQNSF